MAGEVHIIQKHFTTAPVSSGVKSDLIRIQILFGLIEKLKTGKLYTVKAEVQHQENGFFYAKFAHGE